MLQKIRISVNNECLLKVALDENDMSQLFVGIQKVIFIIFFFPLLLMVTIKNFFVFIVEKIC